MNLLSTTSRVIYHDNTQIQRFISGLCCRTRGLTTAQGVVLKPYQTELEGFTSSNDVRIHHIHFK